MPINHRRRFLRIASLGLGLCLGAGVFSTQAAASSCGIEKPVKVIVGYGAGGGTDSYARILASVIPEFLDGQPMVVINKAGGAQVPAMKFVKSSRPDGHTLQVIAMGGGLMSTMIRDRGINWFEDFEPVAQFGLTNQALVVQKKSSIRTAEDLIASIKKAHAGGKKTRWSHPGRGSVSHVGVTAFLSMNDVLKMTQDVPFKGGAQTRNALISGEVAFSASGAHTVPAFSDLLHAVGLLSDQRDTVVKDIPTLKEQRLKFVRTLSPIVLAAPKKTSPEYISCVSAAVEKATKHKAFKSLTKKAKQAVVYRNAADTKAFLQQLAAQWKPAVAYVRNRLKK